MRALIALLAIIVLAKAVAPICDYNTTCIHFNNDCTGYNNFCSDGNQCTSGGVCAAQPVLGAPCSTLACWDADYDGVECASGTCKYSNIYLAGDACDTSANFDNGGCVEGLTCTGGKCVPTTAGSCAASSFTFACDAGKYCNLGAGTCDARLAAGTTCTTPQGNECDYTLICTDRGSSGAGLTCQTPFFQTAGQSCSSLYDCAGDLYCSSSGTCTAVPSDGEDCTADASICGSEKDCVCDLKTSKDVTTDTGKAHCVFDQGYLTKGQVSALISIQTCLKSKGCHDYADYKIAGANSGPNQCIAQCFKGGFETGFEKMGDKYDRCAALGSSNAAAIVPVLAVMLAVLAVLFM